MVGTNQNKLSERLPLPDKRGIENSQKEINRTVRRYPVNSKLPCP